MCLVHVQINYMCMWLNLSLSIYFKTFKGEKCLLILLFCAYQLQCNVLHEISFSIDFRFLTYVIYRFSLYIIYIFIINMDKTRSE